MLAILASFAAFDLRLACGCRSWLLLSPFLLSTLCWIEPLVSADLSTKKPCIATLSGMSFVMGCMYSEYHRREALVSPIPLRNYHIARDEEVVADLLHGTLTSAKALVAPTTTMTPSTPLTNVPSGVSITPNTPPLESRPSLGSLRGERGFA